MYSEGSVVGKASTIGTPHLIFTMGQKVQNLASYSTSLNFEPPAFENAARYPNLETKFLCKNDRFMPPTTFVKLVLCTPEKRSVKLPQPLKFHGENVLNHK